jgi:hypothetical protein
MDARQLHAVFSQRRIYQTWHIDGGNALYTYQLNYNKSLSFSLIRSNLLYYRSYGSWLSKMSMVAPHHSALGIPVSSGPIAALALSILLGDGQPAVFRGANAPNVACMS